MNSRAYSVTAIAVLLLIIMCGCSSVRPDVVRVEWAHVSHAQVGPPFSARTDEDSLDALSVIARWQRGGWYAEMGPAYKLADGGFYGPDLAFTSRIGREFRFDQWLTK